MPLPYRPEIDGLRAIAVIAVLLYHAGFAVAGHPLLPGGFIGVDVFFVISGYLITSIVVKELDAGVFTFGNFYLRRARRILPALALVIACSTVAAMLIMRLEALREYFATALAALWFSSNVVLWRQGSYYAEPSELKPLLHTWSLGIEEQFYLGFPLLLYAIYRYAPGILRTHALTLFALGSALSLILAEWASRYYPAANFYLLPTRAWELLAGAILAVAAAAPRPEQARAAIGAGAGFALICFAFVTFGAETRHPAFVTFIPVVGTMLIIRFSGVMADPATRLLRSPALVATGLVSYGLYLWHFPLFAFHRYALGEPSTVIKIALCAAALLLAALSYHLVEKPLRFSRAVSAPGFVRGAGLAVLVLSTATALGYGSIERQVSTLVVNGRSFDLDAEKQKRFARSTADCRQLGFSACNRPQNGMRNVLIVGDSIVDDTYNILDSAYPDIHFMRSTRGGCPPHPDLTSVLDFELAQLQECLRLNRARFDPNALRGVDGVVIHVDYSWFTPQDLIPYLDFLRASGVSNIMLFGTYIRLTQSMAESLPVFAEGPQSNLLSSTVVQSSFSFDDELAALAASYAADFISIRQAVCDGSFCPAFIGDYPFSWDAVHFSLEFSEYLATQLAPQLRNSWLDRL